MHDELFDPMSPEAPAILDLARRAAPDVPLSLHSHESAHGLVGADACRASLAELLALQPALYESILDHAVANHRAGVERSVEGPCPSSPSADVGPARTLHRPDRRDAARRRRQTHHLRRPRRTRA